MAGLWFFLKTLVSSLVIVLLLQIRIGGTTLEQKTIAAASNSLWLSPIEGVVEASVMGLHRGWDRITNHVKSRAFRPGSRESIFKFERHPEVIKKAEDAASKAL